MRITLSLATMLLAAALNVSTHAQQPAADPGGAGWRAIQNNDGEAARDLFARALLVRPDDAVLHLGAGAAAHLLGEDAAAARSLQRALAIDPTLTIASKLLGEIAFQRGDLDLAIDTYERAVLHAPDSFELSSRLDVLTAEAERRASAARFIVTTSGPRDDSLMAHATKVASAAYWRVAKLVGAYPAEQITIELHTAQPFTDRVGAVSQTGNFDGRIVINTAGAIDDLTSFDRVLAHQLTHAMVISMAPTGVPGWFHEGLAQLVEPADINLAEGRLRAGGTIPWAVMNDVLRHDAEDAQTRHDISLLVVRALLDRIGTRSTVLLDGLADGQPLDAALAQFGFSYADLQADVVNCLR